MRDDARPGDPSSSVHTLGAAGSVPITCANALFLISRRWSRARMAELGDSWQPIAATIESATDGKFTRALSILRAQYRRQGNHLDLDDVYRLCARLAFGLDETRSVIAHLKSVGLDLPSTDAIGQEAPAHIERLLPTDKSRDGIRRFLIDVRRHSVPTREEEIRLGRRIRLGQAARAKLESGAAADPSLIALIGEGQHAETRLVLGNLRLVVWHAMRLRAIMRGLEMLDLLQEGAIGLGIAAERFDPEIGAKFATYATWWIWQRMIRAIETQGRMIRLPLHIHTRMRVVAKAKERLTREWAGDRRPGISDLAIETGFAPKEVALLLQMERDVVSLDEPGTDDDDDAPSAIVVPDKRTSDPLERIAMEQLRNTVERLLSELKKRERTVVELRFGLGGCGRHTLEEVGIELGVTRERVRQIERKAVERLGHPARRRQLAPFVDGATDD